jgi:hypothetical protein
MFLVIFCLIFFNLTLDNFMSLLLISEFIVIIIFYLYIFSSLIFSINWIFGFSFIILILSGLELALAFLILFL